MNLDFILLTQAMGVHAIQCEMFEELLEKMKELKFFTQVNYYGHKDHTDVFFLHKHLLPMSKLTTTLFNQPTYPRPPTVHHRRYPSYQTHSPSDLCCTLPFAQTEDLLHEHRFFTTLFFLFHSFTFPPNPTPSFPFLL
jgi:hypothetical protein